MSSLGERSREIGKIVRMIEEVAGETHLLALNAAILAAQSGRGEGLRGRGRRDPRALRTRVRGGFQIGDLLSAIQARSSPCRSR
jgi:hypothetical protein